MFDRARFCRGAQLVVQGRKATRTETAETARTETTRTETAETARTETARKTTGTETARKTTRTETARTETTYIHGLVRSIESGIRSG